MAERDPAQRPNVPKNDVYLTDCKFCLGYNSELRKVMGSDRHPYSDTTMRCERCGIALANHSFGHPHVTLLREVDGGAYDNTSRVTEPECAGFTLNIVQRSI